MTLDPRDALRLTLASLRAHKLRSLLAAIGVMLGVASVIGVVTLGAGFQSVITDAIGSQVDSTTIILGAQSRAQEGGGPPGGFGAGAAGIFTDRDVDALAKLPHVHNATASVSLPDAEVRLGDKLLAGLSVAAHRGDRPVALDAGRAPAAADEATVSNLTAARLQR